MKIFYGVQATGNGHISRAMEILPYLQKYGHVDIFLSGNNSTLPSSLPVAYKSRGISLFNNTEGGLDFRKMISHNPWIQSLKEAASLPVDQYDLVINDFEPITALACHLKKKNSVQFSHQASFRSSLTPRPLKTNLLGEWIFRNYSYSSTYFGLHFLPYDKFILPPVIRQTIKVAEPVDLGHITVYLFGGHRAYFEQQFHEYPDCLFHCFIPGISNAIRSKNIIFYPIDQTLFTQSLIQSHGVITGGGFETPSEALYLKKRLLCMPCKLHYEQYCNAAALNLMGISIIPPEDHAKLKDYLPGLLNQSQPAIDLIPNNLKETILQLLDTISYPVESGNIFQGEVYPV